MKVLFQQEITDVYLNCVHVVELQIKIITYMSPITLTMTHGRKTYTFVFNIPPYIGDNIFNDMGSSPGYILEKITISLRKT